MASRVKKVGWAKTCNFPTDSCKCPTEQIKGARNFNFAPKLTNFSPKLRIFGGKNSDKLKFRGGGDCPPAPSHDATAQRSIKRICLWPLTECTELLRGANECRCCCCCCSVLTHRPTNPAHRSTTLHVTALTRLLQNKTN